MKTKTFAIIVSTMVFGMALLTGIVVVAILVISRDVNSSEAGFQIASDNTTNTTTSAQVSTQAQADFIYLYDSPARELVRVSLVDGSSQRFGLGLPTDNSVYFNRMAFTNDGRLVAFCIANRQSDEIVTHRLVIWDIEAQTTVRDSHFGQLHGCEVSAFNPQGTEVAVGIVHNSPVMGDINDPNQPDWSLQINSVYEYALTDLLRQTDATAPDYESMREDFWFDEGIPAMVLVEAYVGNDILMTAFPYIGRDGPLKVPAHRWNRTTDEITPIVGLTQLTAQYLPATGEIVYAEEDTAYPAAQPIGPMPLANTIRINDNDDIRTIYRNTDYVIGSTTFINGGRQIIASLIGAWDENNPDQIAPARYEIINRDGSLGQISSDLPFYSSIAGTSDGMLLYYVDQRGADGNIASLYEYVNGQVNTIWTQELPSQGWLEFVWSPEMPVADGLPPFAMLN